MARKPSWRLPRSLGGIEIRVPDSWNVTFEAVAILAGSSDERRRTPIPAAGVTPKHLIIRGAAVLAGVEVKKLNGAMHPVFSPIRRLPLYLLAWIPLAFLLAYLFFDRRRRFPDVSLRCSPPTVA